mgnify:CR=1 FL=1
MSIRTDVFKNLYKPDVLSCLADLSNDEVFTPPDIANRLLDMLPQELFRNPDTKFLDPACKSGVFLREIAKRLIAGLADKIPNLQERCDWIFHHQLYGIAITELTSLLARRSVYCSKYANGPFSVSHFDTPVGNIVFHKTKHKWDRRNKKGHCIFCGTAYKGTLNDVKRDGMESHAYEFIHTLHPEEIFNMKFDVIISNPPYQLNDGGGNGASAAPIYQLFVEKAMKLNPRYLTMITPSRWFTGGKGLDTFRDHMLHDTHLRIIHDFPEASDCFPNVQIKGGVSYFLWDRDNNGECTVYSHKGDKVSTPVTRPLLERGCDTFIRYNEAISIFHKVQEKNEKSMESIVSSRMPFGFPNTFKGYKTKDNSSDVVIYVSGNNRDIRGTVAYVPRDKILKGNQWIDKPKVFIGKAGSGSDSFPHPILPKPFYGEPGSVCNESYLLIGPFTTKKECQNVISYICTKFFRFLVMLKKNSQNAPKGVYSLVPQQDFSKPWTDGELYKKYGITKEEQTFIDTMIRPMNLNMEGGAN